MKQGYTEIPSTSIHPEIDNNEKFNKIKVTEKTQKFFIGISITVLLLALAYHEKTSSQSNKSSTTNGSKLICEYYINPNLKLNSIKNVSFIQSSIESSEFWQLNTCRTNNIYNENDEETTEAEAVIYIDWDGDISSKKLNFDPILGFGGAFTEASSFNLKSLSKEGQDAILQLLFGKNGLGYTLGRVPINSCDYSLGSYNFDTTEDDFDLLYFDGNVTHDVENGMIEFIKSANEILSMSWNDDIKLIASPWSPPAWMKAPVKDTDNATHASSMDQTAFPVGLRNGTSVHSKYAKSWALYFSKYLSAYKNHGITFWAVTVQNEPFYNAPWEACAYDKSSQKEFIQYHLGPVLKVNHPNVKLFAYDFNKDVAADWALYLLNDNNDSVDYIDGIAMHWYGNTIDRQLDGKVGAANMHKVKQIITDSHDNNPKKRFLIGTEACNCPSTGYKIQSKKLLFDRAERYAHSILFDLAAGSQGWMEWNLILNGDGGPNHLNNYCDAGLLAISNSTTNNRYDEFDDVDINNMYPKQYLDHGIVVQPMYYFMGHFSKYLRPGSKSLMSIVDTKKTRTFRPYGQTKPGGGKNFNARIGIEVTTWPCEGSTRQSWHFENGRLFVNEEKPFNFDTDGGNERKLCLSNNVDPYFNGVSLIECDSIKAAELRMMHYDDETRIRFQLMNHDNIDKNDLCLDITPLANLGGAYGERGGMQTSYRACNDSVFWNYAFDTGEVVTYSRTSFSQIKDKTASAEKETCLTTGYPFLQVGFFDTSKSNNHKRVLIILNEADNEAKFSVKTGRNSDYFYSAHEENENIVILKSGIPPHSIQTYTF